MNQTIENDNRNAWHAKDTDAVLGELSVKRNRGLDNGEVKKRADKFGKNQISKAKERSIWEILWNQINSIVVYLLIAAAILAFLTGKYPEGFAVTVVVVINVAIGFISEWRAIKSMEALRKMSEHKVTVRREGEEKQIKSTELVPGDIVLLEKGQLIPADMRLLESNKVRVNEASLTGESVPVNKTTSVVKEDADLAERQNMIYKGTSLADGYGEAIVVNIGDSTELGKISKLAEEAEPSITPLQRRLNQLGRRLAWLTVIIASFIAVIGSIVRHEETALIVETALALGIAAIPEGLPIVATIALARGMYLMAQHQALVNKLTAVETLGATTVIFSDKTGTLTENKMILRKVSTAQGEDEIQKSIEDQQLAEQKADIKELSRVVIEIGTLCNTASLGQEDDANKPSGDPTEIGILLGAKAIDLTRSELLKKYEQVNISEFDPREKKMATFHKSEEGVLVAVKGAPGAILEVCTHLLHSPKEEPRKITDHDKSEWLNRANELASEGLRILAVAKKQVGNKDVTPYENLCFLGLLGLLDPPRADVKVAIDTCQSAGIAVKMVTGDNAETAKAIAKSVGMIGDKDDPEARVLPGSAIKKEDQLNEEELNNILRANVFARVSPEQKLNLISIYQKKQHNIIAMTGDGVNDAPALKKADIGIAMGQRGTEAAKQVADMILKNDAFKTIIAAVRQGRIIFQNIRMSVMFMLCTNVAEVVAVTVAALAGWPLPLRPMQILYLNILTDVFPALALGVGPGTGAEMKQPPRNPKESILTRKHWLEIGGWASLIALCVLASFLLAQRWLELNTAAAVTVSFMTLAFGKLWFTFNLRSPGSHFFRNEVTRNKYVWIALMLCAVLLVSAIYFPPLAELLDTKTLNFNAWMLVFAMSLVPFLVGQFTRTYQRDKNES